MGSDARHSRWGFLGSAPQRVILQRKSGEKRRPHRSRGRRRVGSLPPVSQLHRTPTASCPADIGPFPRRRPNLHFTLPTLLIVLCRPGVSLARLVSQSRVRDQLGHFLLEFPHLFLELLSEMPRNRDASTLSLAEAAPSPQRAARAEKRPIPGSPRDSAGRPYPDVVPEDRFSVRRGAQFNPKRVPAESGPTVFRSGYAQLRRVRCLKTAGCSVVLQ